MSSIPTNAARVPNLMLSNIALFNLNRPNVELARVQTQLSTGLRVARPSDDAVAASTIQLINGRLERSEQTLRNLDHADSALLTLDSTLAEANDLVLEAEAIASAQVNFGTSPEEREGQAVIVDSLIERLFRLANRESVVGYMFGGTVPGRQPVEGFGGGYRYAGEGSGIVTDLNIGFDVPLTLGGDNIVGRTSTRIQGTTELQPELTPGARLTDLLGARGLGVETGIVRALVNGNDTIEIDLSEADTAEDVQALLGRAFRDYEEANTTTLLGPDGVALAPTGVRIDLEGANTVEFLDLGTGRTALDLGLRDDDGFVFDGTNADGFDVQPKLTPLSPVGLVDGLPLGSIRITNLGRTADIDLSRAETWQDVQNAIESANLGVRVEIDPENRRINIVNEVAAGASGALSIEEIPGNDGTATRLGIRSLSVDTRLEDFNEGRGVGIVDGLPTPDLNNDFVITLGNGATINVDLRPQDITTVGATIARIREAADEQLPGQGVNPADFTVGLTDGPNGLALEQSGPLAAAGALTVTRDNNSLAAVDLGLLSGTYDAATGQLVAEDTARVRVDNLFTSLIDLRDALLSNDTNGIGIAGEKLSESIDDVSQVRAIVGGYAKRVETAIRFEEDRAVLDEQTRSQLQDLDYFEASSRFSLLQAQLQAGLQVTAQSNQLSLLDFLG
jgi:flagellin-like hook-associated protein FlgL